MIGVGLRRGVLAVVGEVLGAGVGVAGRGVWLFDVFATDAGGAVGVATGADGESKLIAPVFQICDRFDALMSISIGTRFGLAGWSGSVICLPFMNS